MSRGYVLSRRVRVAKPLYVWLLLPPWVDVAVPVHRGLVRRGVLLQQCDAGARAPVSRGVLWGHDGAVHLGVLRSMRGAILLRRRVQQRHSIHGLDLPDGVLLHDHGGGAASRAAVSGGVLWLLHGALGCYVHEHLLRRLLLSSWFHKLQHFVLWIWLLLSHWRVVADAVPCRKLFVVLFFIIMLLVCCERQYVLLRREFAGSE